MSTPPPNYQLPIPVTGEKMRKKEDEGGKGRNTFHTLFFYNCLIIFAIHFKNHVIGGGFPNFPAL